MSAIDYANKRLSECNAAEDCIGVQYWVGYRDGAIAQQKDSVIMSCTINVPEWISVNDRLPEECPENAGKKVIPCIVALKSTYPNGKPAIQKRQRQISYSDKKSWEWSRIGANRITHWMPLPLPPKEDAE